MSLRAIGWSQYILAKEFVFQWAALEDAYTAERDPRMKAELRQLADNTHATCKRVCHTIAEPEICRFLWEASMGHYHLFGTSDLAFRGKR